MTPSLLKKRALFCALFFFLQGCCHNCAWDLDEIQSHCPEFSSARLHSIHKANFNGLELEIIHSSCYERLYLNIHGFPLACGDIQTVEAITRGQTLTIQAYLFEGGQRLLLEETGAQAIIQALYEGQTVTIRVGNYSKEFEPDNFPELYSDILEQF